MSLAPVSLQPVAHDLLAGLTSSQRQAVTIDAAPLCILAGAGSGKTRVLTRRIAHRISNQQVEPANVLALTFTRKAANELVIRLDQLGVRNRIKAGTFHSVAYAQLRRWWSERDMTPPVLLKSKVGLVAELMGTRSSRTGLSVQPADVASELEWAAARLLTPETYAPAARAAQRSLPLDADVISSIYRRYQQEKQRRRVIDFDDLLACAASALETDSAFAAATRWQIRHLFVDEYQDVNPLQAKLLDLWRGGRADLCVVGDPHQAIYGWNGADPDRLVRFRDHYPDATVLRLSDNFRSTPQVLAVADSALGRAMRAAAAPTAHRPTGTIPTVVALDSDVAEAEHIAGAMQDAARRGRSWRELAVLVRTNAQIALFEEALRARRIPFRTRVGARLLDQPEVRAALGSLDRGNSQRLPLTRQLDDLQEAIDDDAALVAERRENLEALIRLGREFAALEPESNASAFRGWLTATTRDDSGANDDAVELTTFHRAKGLEWPEVWIAGVERGFVPHASSTSPEALAEERRLLYVAITRAEQRLTFSWARSRTFGSRSATRVASPMLADIDDTIAALNQAGNGADWRKIRDQIRARRAQERATQPRRTAPTTGPKLGDNADPASLAALKEWRRNAARATAVPAYIIFHDTTLAAIAEARPQTLDELLCVPGLGPVKVERYGTALLAALSAASVAASAKETTPAAS